MTPNRPLPFDDPGPGEAPKAPPAPTRVPAGENLPESTEMTLNEWLANLWGGRYLILACVALAMVFCWYYLYNYLPIYRVDALVQIEPYKRSMMDKALADLDTALAGGTEAQTELEIIRSNLVIGRAVETLGLDISTRPDLPRFSSEASIRRKGRMPLAEVESFVLPDHLRGRGFRIVSLGGDAYRWETMDGKALGSGLVGQTLSARLGEDTLRLQVRRFRNAPAGQAFTLSRQPLLAAIGGVRGNLVVTERGRYTGILGLSFTGPDPVESSRTLNEVMTQYIRQNLERKSEEVSKTLSFLNQQLPTLKARLDESEDALNRFRQRSGAVDLSAEAQMLLKQSVDLNASMLQMKQKKDELLRTYKEGSDVVVTLNEQYTKLAKEASQVESRVRALPKTQQEVVGLTRDVQLNNTLYTALLSNIQQLQVVNAGQVGNARIVDFAVPSLSPVKPNRRGIQTTFLAMGFASGVGLVMLRMLLHRGVKDPHLIEQKLGLPVYVTIPHSLAQEAQTRSIKHGMQGTHLLAFNSPDDIAIESLRSLRTTLHFTLADASNRAIVFAGPAPGIGKSFVSANFAAVLAQGGGRVLLVDGDMRKGTLHHHFGVKSRRNGFSEILAGQVGWEQVVHRTAITGLEVIFSGVVPPNPSELLMKDRYGSFLSEVSDAYNYVIFDAPPMMAVTDALILAAKAGTLLLIAKFGEHPLEEIRTCQARCEDIGVHISGCVFNDVLVSEFSDRYYRYGYHYTYK